MYMAVHKGFDNKFYLNVWERKQDCLCTLNFEVWSYFNLFLLCPTNFCLVQHYLFKGELARLLMNQVVTRI